MLIRPYRDGDQPTIQCLLERSWPHDPVLCELHNLHGPAQTDPLRQTLIAEVEGRVAGAGTGRLSLRHPARYWLSLNVDPGHRRTGIGSRLLNELRGHIAHDPRPFRAQARPSDSETMAFLRHRGFRPLMQTREGILDPREPALRHRLDHLSNGAKRFRLAHPPDSTLDSIANFYIDWYAAIHQWDPPAPWPPDEAVHHFCGPDLVRESLICAYDEDSLVGAASLIVPPFDPQPGELYLVQVGALGLPQPEAHALTARLVNHLLTFAADRHSLIRYEVDAAHTDLWAIIDSLPRLSDSDDFMILTT